MAYIIAEPCIGTLDKSCVAVCPVDCIYEIEGADQLLIHPEECIDCGACVDPCPVDAIYHEDELPDKWKDFIEKNRDGFPDLRTPPEDTKIVSNPPYEK
jgi:ferredoxin